MQSSTDFLGESQSIVEYLPNLPGFRSNGSTIRSGTKKQCFEVVRGLIFLKDAALPPLEKVDIQDKSVLTIGAGTSSLLNVDKSQKQELIKQAGLVLTFTAYFRESVPVDDGIEEDRVRTCLIFFNIEDSKIMVVEKSQLNSGIPQGKLVKKSIVYRQDGTPFTAADFHVGEEVLIYNRVYHIVDADSSTRKYIRKTQGIEECPALDIPKDPYQVSRRFLEKGKPNGDRTQFASKKNANKTFMQVMKGNYTDNSGRDGFMLYGNKSLKFKCVWDNTYQLYGDRQYFSFNYYLADDNVEIFGIPTPNSGRDQFSRLLKKSKLPKVMSSLTLDTDVDKPESFHWTELFIGMEINVYARKLRLVDCDAATRKFYEMCGRPLAPSEIPPEPVIVVYEREIPPHNGIGSEEDTLRSCNGPLLPGPVPAKKMGENKVISFFASLLSGGIDDVNRRFVITFYVVDNTLKVQEPPIRNSGFNGGVFLSRRSIKGSNGEVLTYHDFFVGCKLQILKHRFLLLDSNESTLKWMEDHGLELPRSNFYVIIDKLRGTLLNDAIDGRLEQLFRQHAEAPGSDRITREGFSKVLAAYGLLGDSESDVSEHEMITILRANGNKTLSFNFVKVVEQIVRPTDEFK